MGEDRLTEDEVVRVLRRASELDLDGRVPHTPEGLPVGAVEAAAAEVGLSPAAVRQAVAELRTGGLDDDGSTIVCARVVPATCAVTVDAVSRWLQGQTMVRARDRGTEQVWRPREDWFAGIQRKLDFAAAFRLKAVDEVVVRAVEVDGGTLVRLTARLEGSITHAPHIGAGIAGGAAGTATSLLAVVDPLFLLAVPPTAAVAGTAGWRVGRHALAKQRWKVADAIDGLLDELELGRDPVSSRRFERLASRARRLRTGYRL